MAQNRNAARKNATKNTNDILTPEKEAKMPLGMKNYLWMLIGFAIIVLGFILMSGGGSKDPNVFSQEIFSFRRITLAPILVLAGFGVEIFAIMKRFKK